MASNADNQDIASLDRLDEQNRMAALGTYIDEMSDLGVVVDADFQFDEVQDLLGGGDSDDGGDNAMMANRDVEPWDRKAQHQHLTDHNSIEAKRPSYSQDPKHPSDEEKALSLLRRYEALYSEYEDVHV